MKIENIKAMIEADELKSKICELYCDENLYEYEKERVLSLLEAYGKDFDDDEVEIYSAPGRCEVGGNHTDHQRGQILAASVNMDVLAVVSKRSDGIVKVRSNNYPMLEIDINDLEKKDDEEGTTLALIKGVLAGLRKRGFAIGGFNGCMTSDVLIGAGLSSSAAFETVIGTIISGLYNDMEISPVTIAIVGQYAENYYFGKPCGLMDQMACSVGSMVNVDFEDSENPIVNKIEFNAADFGYSMCITDTKGSHANLTPDYAAIPAEMKEVAACFGKKLLREVDADEFYASIGELKGKVSDRSILRAIHFFEENKRVAREVQALENKDFEAFLKAFGESSASSFRFLQNVYSNSDVASQGVSLGIAVSEVVLAGDGVARVHGGGFAGTIQTFLKTEKVADYIKAMDAVFGQGACKAVQIRGCGGIKFLV